MSVPSTEDNLIARYFKPLATDSAARGLIDDAAVLSASNDDLVITTDAIVEGVHFLPDDPPGTIACKALRVNLSDLAAKGAAPAGFVLTLALRDVRDEFLSPFAQALGEDVARYDCPLLGGDTVATPGALTISITAFGRVPSGRAVHRAGAQVGDRIFVSGTIGDAVLGLDALQGRLDVIDDAHREYLTTRYRVPQPRTLLASAVRDYANAAMDVSDGLVGDLTKLCAASHVSARIEAKTIPLSVAARAVVDSDAIGLSRLFSGGDDYEILCAVPPDRIRAFTDAAATAGMLVTDIGVVVDASSELALIAPDGTRMAFDVASYSHFTE